eukprot:7153398-Prymnesium_polylepis.4
MMVTECTLSAKRRSLLRRNAAASVIDEMQTTSTDSWSSPMSTRRSSASASCSTSSSAARYANAVSEKRSLCEVQPPSVPAATGTSPKPNVLSVPLARRARSKDGCRLAMTAIGRRNLREVSDASMMSASSSSRS